MTEAETGVARDTAFVTWDNKVTALKLFREYPLVLLVKVSWTEGRAFRSEKGEEVGR
jgi:hypothetical protein